MVRTARRVVRTLLTTELLLLSMPFRRHFKISLFSFNLANSHWCRSVRASAGRSSIRHWRKDLTNDEKKCNSFRQFDESIKTKYFH